MPTLAPKLPWTHAFAGGYPRLGGQPLPTDPDAIDYLNRVAAADGAAVEVGVAMAVDQFVKGCKADSAGYAGDPTRTVWDALQASCIMCGARTLAGALVPLKGDAPTNVANNFVSSDYDRSGGGLKGDGSTKYLDTNFSDASVDTDDIHMATYVSAFPTVSNSRYMGSGVTAAPSSSMQLQHFLSRHWSYNRSRGIYYDTGDRGLGFFGTSRDEASHYDVRSNAITDSPSDVSFSTDGTSVKVFGYASGSGLSDARLAFYSIGSALDLAALDNRVTQLVTGIKFHSLTGLVATDYDPDTVAYIVAAYEAGGTL